ncbi:MAG: inner membrane-spanning protein YciB [Pseudomonadota bacterium]
MSATDAAPRRLSQNAKLAVDLGPLAVFFIGYFFGDRLAPIMGSVLGQDWSVGEGKEMFVALGLFMPAFFTAFAYSVWKERRVAPMLMVNGVIVGVLGSITLLSGDKTFFFMKPTVLYGFFALALGGGVISGRNFLKILFDGAFDLPDDAWRTLTVRYAGFFAVLALANELAWRWLTRECDLSADDAQCAGEATWVNLKIFGFTAASLIFTALQAPFLMKHIQGDPGKKAP